MLLPLILLCIAAHQHSASALIELVACEPAAGSMLAIGAHVWCEFAIDTDRLPMESAALDVSLAGREQFPVFATEFNGTINVKQLNAKQPLSPHTVTHGNGKHALVVVFPYSECTVTGVTLALRIQINRDLRTEPIYFRQAHACVLSSTDTTEGTQATASGLIILVLLVLVIICLACIYIDPRG